MSVKLKNNKSFKTNEDMREAMQSVAEELDMTVSQTIRMAWDYFYKSRKGVAKALKVLLESTPRDSHSIRFAGKQAYISNKVRLLLHKNAAQDIQNLGEIADQTIMEFIRSSISDGTLLSKGEIKTSDGTNIALFRVHTYDVYCHFAQAQITILSVS